MEPTIKTYRGTYFNFLYPNESKISIHDIAHALSNTCRFGGHCSSFYSVAQHAVLVSHLVPKEFAWQGLHHDDAEAYLGDIPTPLKNLLPDFQKIEKNVESVINNFFNLPQKYDKSVKIADLQALMLEKNALIPSHGDTTVWQCFDGIPAPKPQTIVPLAPKEAEVLYMTRFTELLLEQSVTA